MSTLKNILQEYCEFENPDRIGLFLLDLPTGFGKTHNVFDYIHEIYQTNPDKKILFITNLKKNLQPEKLKERFADKEEYEKVSIFVDSNVEYVFKNLEKVYDLIPDTIKDTEQFKSLYENINFCKSFDGVTDLQKLKWQERIREEIRLKHEPGFRYFIQRKLYKQYKTKDERQNAIKNDTAYSWLPILYPTVLSSQKQIFFLSVDKFLVKNTPIIEASHYFTDDSFLETRKTKALIFIDEFDASKEIFLKRIIENQLQRKVDLIGLFTQIFTSLNALQLPEIFKRDSQERKKRQEKSKEVPKVKDVLDDLVKKANEINEKYEITYFIKTKDLEHDKNFLFHDYRYHTIIGGEQKFIYLRKDEKESIRYIEFDEQRTGTKDTPNIIEYIGITKGFINYFKKKSAIIAENYQQIKNEIAGEKDDKFLFENALRTFFNALNIDRNFQNFLIDTIEQRSFKKQERKSDFKNVGFYPRGFRYFDFEDSEQHDIQSRIYLTSFDITPEEMLLNLAKENMVVGISATARNQSVVGNFDLAYLKKQLGDTFYEISDERKILQEEFNEKTAGYEKLNIIAELIDSPSDVEFALENLFGDESIANEIFTEIEAAVDYCQKRYLRIAKAFEEFVQHDDIKSMICFLNAHPSKKNPNLHIDTLTNIFDAIIRKHEKQSVFTKKDYKPENSFYVLNSTNFEVQLKKLKKRLGNGEKIFVISTYQTLGAGQNIQYPLPKDVETVEIYQRKGDNQKDFDAIYLDKPTNLLVNIKGEKIEEFDLARRIFHLEMLFGNKGGTEIFYSHMIYEIKKTFQKAFEKKYNIWYPREEHKNLYTTQSYHNFVAKQIIQAVGRINRTNHKNKNIYIFADSEIAKSLNNWDASDAILLKEFEALMNECRLEQLGENESQGFNKEYNDSCNFHSYGFIRDKIRSRWRYDDDIQDWQELRGFVLKYPTLSAEKHLGTDWDFIYLKSPKKNNRYSYTQENDYQQVSVDFFANTGSEVSEKAVYLQELMKIDFVFKHFTKKGFATSFATNEYILTPIMFNNIYKGALGEEIGKLILESFLNIHLEELPKQYYEKFDFVYKDIYIDFKFWNEEAGGVSKEKLHRHIRNKMEQTGAEKALIINLLASERYKVQSSIDNRLIEVPYLINKQTFEVDLDVISQLKNILQ